MSEFMNTNLVDQAARTLMEEAADAYFILDRGGRIHFLNERAERIAGRPRKDCIGNHFEHVVTVITEDNEDIGKKCVKNSEKLLEALIKTQNGLIPVEIFIKPMRMKKIEGTVLIVKMKSRGCAFIRSLEALGSAIQRHSNTQTIYETLGEALGAQEITMAMFPLEEDSFTFGYHTFDVKKMNITEFVMGIPLSEIRLTLTENASKKITEQKSLFFSDLSSVLESAMLKFTTPQLLRFFSLAGFSRGVVAPITFGEELKGILVLFSAELQLEDAPAVSTLGVQVSAALERADHFEKMVVDLKALEEQISSRTQELEKVKSRMESIVQSSVDAIMAASIDGRITFVNKGVETMFGYSKADILGQKITKYYAGGKKEAKRLRTIIMRQGQIENAELDFIAKGGRVVHTLASLSQLKTEKGVITGIMAVLKDVTEQKKLQQTLESLNKAASHIQKARTKEEIFTVAAEELKRLDFHVVFMLFDEDRTTGRVVHLTGKDVLGSLESIAGMSLEDLRFPLNNTIYKRLIKKKEALYIQNLQSTAKLVVPSRLLQVSEKGLDILGFSNKKSVLAPLIRYGKTIGYLAVISDLITSQDIPSVMAFANQVSTALENARLLEESQKRADALAANLEEQQILRELNTNLFLAQSQDEVLDAAIGGIHKLGKSFSNISLINENRTHATIVRLEMERNLLKVAEKLVQKFLFRSTLVGYQVPVWEEDNIYHHFFNNQIPLITSNIQVHNHPVMKAEISDIYHGFFPKSSVFQSVAKRVTRSFPYKSVMVFPIIVGGTTIGTLTVTSNEVFSERDFTLMSTVGEMVSSAMERIAHSEKLTETLNELRAVQRINTLLNMGAPLEQILTQVCTSIEEVYHYQFAYPLLLDPSRRYLTFTHVLVPSKTAKKFRKALGIDLRDFKYPLTEDFSFFNTVIEEKKCVIRKGFEEIAEEMPVELLKSAMKTLSSDLSRELGLKPGENNIMIAPLPYGEEVIGVLLLGHRKLLTQEDFQHLEYFLDQVGIAIAKSDVESRLRRSLEELRELDRMKSEFIDIASHELRTPLTTLKLYLEMIALEQYGKLSEQLKERIRVMEEGVNRLEEIINQTLVASRLIKNKLELEKKSVSLLEIATDVVRQLRPLWKAKNQNIFLESSSDISDVEGDVKTLSTVVSNLVDNAIRYSPENTEILIKFTEHPREIECSIIDQGCGIPPEHIEKIFEEFYIIPSKTEYARMDGRTGLGLFIAKGILERHGGKIWAESTLREGSTFHFVLPKKMEQLL